MRHVQRAAALAAVLALSATPLWSQQGHDKGQMGGMMQDGMMSDMAQMMRIHVYDPSQLLQEKADLALTADQVSKLEALVQEVKAAKVKAKTDHDAHHAQVAVLFEKTSPDAAQVSEHVRAAMSAMANGHAVEVSAFARAKGLLTIQQQQEVESWATEHEKMMKGHGADSHRN